jgi:hypothetical protein
VQTIPSITESALNACGVNDSTIAEMQMFTTVFIRQNAIEKAKYYKKPSSDQILSELSQ